MDPENANADGGRHEDGHAGRRRGGGNRRPMNKGKPRFQSGGPNDRGAGDKSMTAWRDEQYIKQKLSQIKEPVVDLPPCNFKETKFQSRNRLYVTNLPTGVTSEEFAELFKQFGEIDDLYLHKDFYGFVRMDFYYNALKAKHILDNSEFKGKNIRIRFSPKSMILVKNLPPFVSNELIHLAFSVFGEVDYCTVLTDARGQTMDQAVIDYKYKRSVATAKKYCNEHYYLLNSCLKPVFVEDCSASHEDDGIPEDQIRKVPPFFKSREKGPRFAVPGSFEYKCAEKYKDLYEQANQKTVEIKIRMQEAEQELESECIEAEFDYETERLKELLMQREMERERIRRSKRDSFPDDFDRMPENDLWNRREGAENRGRGFGGPDFSNNNDKRFPDASPMIGPFDKDRPSLLDEDMIRNRGDEPHRKRDEPTYSRHGPVSETLEKIEAEPVDIPAALVNDKIKPDEVLHIIPPNNGADRIIDDKHYDDRHRNDQKPRDWDEYGDHRYEDLERKERDMRDRNSRDHDSGYWVYDQSRDRLMDEYRRDRMDEERNYDRNSRKRGDSDYPGPHFEDPWLKRPRY